MTKSGIFEEQRDLAQEDVSNNKSFCNETDKGYRFIEAAFREGKQQIIQPDFAKSDLKIKGMQVLTSAAIATDRGVNKRVV